MLFLRFFLFRILLRCIQVEKRMVVCSEISDFGVMGSCGAEILIYIVILSTKGCQLGLYFPPGWEPFFAVHCAQFLDRSIIDRQLAAMLFAESFLILGFQILTVNCLGFVVLLQSITDAFQPGQFLLQFLTLVGKSCVIS